MKTLKIKFQKWLMIAMALMLAINVSAQSYYQVEGGTYTVEGTSTLHDWTMKSTSASGTANIDMENGKINQIQALTVNIPATSLKSGKGAMDNIAYDALKSKENKYIKFVLTEVREIKYSGNVAYVTAVGNLTIAGVTKTVVLNVTGKTSGNDVSFDGKASFKMSYFNIDPPTAAFGTIKTGDKITINFNVNYKNTNPKI